MSPTAQCIRLQILAEATNQADLREAQGPMSGGTQLVFLLGIGSELNAALRASPCFSRGNQLSPDATLPRFGFNKPALEIAHSIGSATLCVRTNGNLGKAQQTRFALGDQHCTTAAQVC
jgi:hypothetical protein